MGNPLVNELIIGTGFKDFWNSVEPENEILFSDFYTTPRLAAVLGAIGVPIPPTPMAPNWMRSFAPSTRAGAMLPKATAPAEAAGYEIRRSIVSGGGYEAVGRSTETSFTDTSVRNGTRYHYVVVALDKAGKTIGDVDRVEINEAFASVTVNSLKMLGADPDKANVNGGAVALGHPVGASGARILGTMIYELRRNGGGLGLAAICSGGGQGDALLLEV